MFGAVFALKLKKKKKNFKNILEINLVEYHFKFVWVNFKTNLNEIRLKLFFKSISYQINLPR